MLSVNATKVCWLLVQKATPTPVSNTTVVAHNECASMKPAPTKLTALFTLNTIVKLHAHNTTKLQTDVKKPDQATVVGIKFANATSLNAHQLQLVIIQNFQSWLLLV
jgi:hypothetical protein